MYACLYKCSDPSLKKGEAAIEHWQRHAQEIPLQRERRLTGDRERQRANLRRKAGGRAGASVSLHPSNVSTPVFRPPQREVHCI